MKKYDKRKISVYLFALCQIITILIAVFISLCYESTIFYLLVLLLVASTLLGDFFIYKIVLGLIDKNKQEAALKSINEQANNYKLFYEFCNIQQDNIRHFYHDLNNHLITLRLLAKSSRKDYDEYLSNLKEKYRNTVVADKTNDILINILIEYYSDSEFQIDILNENEADDIDYLELLNLFDDLKKECNLVTIDFKKRIINADVNSEELTNKYSNYIFIK